MRNLLLRIYRTHNEEVKGSMIQVTRDQVLAIYRALENDPTIERVSLETDAAGKLRASVTEMREVTRALRLTGRAKEASPQAS